MTMIERKRLHKPTKDELLANFKGKRNRQGRKKGVPNKLTTTLKTAIMLAAAAEGSDGKGKDGLVGYLRMVARDMPKTYTHLLGKLLPLEVQAKLMQLQLQLQAHGNMPSGGMNVDEIRNASTEELHESLHLLRRVMIRKTPPTLQRLDQGAIDAETIEHEATPAAGTRQHGEPQQG